MLLALVWPCILRSHSAFSILAFAGGVRFSARSQYSWWVVLSAWQKARSDLEAFVPTDFNEEPAVFLPNVSDADTRIWALAVHRLWAQLCRKVCPVPC